MKCKLNEDEINRTHRGAGSFDADRKLCESCEWREVEKQNGGNGHCYMFREFMPFCRRLKISFR
ncbi:MAG: hypothetical protein WAZ30_11465 [Syntrophorhabdus sp.]|jgi:hypothetical protein